MMKIFYLLLLCLWVSSFINAQDTTAHFFQLTYSNDYFTATDYYYTQGIRLEYGKEKRSFFIAQEGYTPTSIRADEILSGDRPYAGALFIGAAGRRCKLIPNWQARWELSAGVIGPLSLAEAEQKWIHRQTGNIEPMGWQYQVTNDLVLNGKLGLSRTVHEKSWSAVTVGGEMWLGSYRTRLVGSSALSLGIMRPRPRQFHYSLHLRPAARIVGYDATLQGGLFNRSSPYTLGAGEIKRVVGQAEGGVRLGVGRFGLEFTHTYLSREFAGGRPHAWGTVRLFWGGS